MVKVISNKDGVTADRAANFASTLAATYRIERDGVVVGSVEKVPSNLNGRSVLRWVVVGDSERCSIETRAFDYLAHAKAYVTSALVEAPTPRLVVSLGELRARKASNGWP